MKSIMIDTHAHLDMPEFDRDREEVIARALTVGVTTIITVGIDLPSSRKAVKLAESRPEILATVGIHPHEAAWVTQKNIAELAQIARHPRVVAIGETGLDYYRHRAPRDAQLRVLKWQLELAAKLMLPVVIHCRQADNDMLNVLNEWTGSRQSAGNKPVGVIHCFNSDNQTARKYLAMGFYIAFGAYIGYPSSLHLRDTIKSISADRLLVETDCPFLSPQLYRGKRNEPSYIPITVKALAEDWGVSPETVATETTQNARRVFHLP